MKGEWGAWRVRGCWAGMERCSTGNRWTALRPTADLRCPLAAAGASLMLVGPRGPVYAAGLYFRNSEWGTWAHALGLQQLQLRVAAFPCGASSDLCASLDPRHPTTPACAGYSPYDGPTTGSLFITAKLSVLTNLGEGITVPVFAPQVPAGAQHSTRLCVGAA